MGINLAAALPRPHWAHAIAARARPSPWRCRSRASRCGNLAGQRRAEGRSRQSGISLPFCAEPS